MLSARLILSFAATFGLFPCFAQAPPASLSSISSSLRAGQFQSALQEADQVLQTNPHDARVLTLKAIALTKLDRNSDAIAAFESALRESPAYVPALAGATQLEYPSGSPSAQAHADELLKLRPDDQTVHAMRAVIAFKQKDCSTAVEHFRRAQQLLPQQPAALEQYGLCLVRLKQLPQAIEIYQQLHQFQSSAPATAYALASVQLMSGQQAAAIKTLSLLASHEDVEALKLTSDAYEQSGDTPNAVSYLRRAIVAAPDRPDLYLEFSALSFDHNSFQVGVRMLDAGLSRLPNNGKLYLARGVLFAQMGQYDKADQDFAKAQLLDAGEASGADAQALALFQGDRLENALAAIDTGLKKRPNDAFLYYLRSEVLTRHGALPGTEEFAQALASATKAVQLKPDFTLARDVLSRLHLESGNTTAAVQQCRLTLKYEPNDQVALYRLLRALKSVSPEANAAEIRSLTARLAQVRQEAREKQQQTNHYRLVEQLSDQPIPPSTK
jgi:tetratricopeptide (TPR) repeat protein